MTTQNDETVTIPRKEYDRLIHSAHDLMLLEWAGADNTEVGDYACQLRLENPCPCASCAEERE